MKIGGNKKVSKPVKVDFYAKSKKEKKMSFERCHHCGLSIRAHETYVDGHECGKCGAFIERLCGISKLADELEAMTNKGDKESEK